MLKTVFRADWMNWGECVDGYWCPLPNYQSYRLLVSTPKLPKLPHRLRVEVENVRR